jgi:GTP-binding protein
MINEKKLILTDSPGMFDYEESDSFLLDGISRKINELLASTDLILFVLDGSTGLTAYDKEIARILRKCGKSVIVVINKSDKKKRIEQVYFEALELGFEDVLRISAEHGNGIDALCQNISDRIPYNGPETEAGAAPEEVIKITIIGRPNVGKSTLINQILGEDRQLVADFAGLTRESAEFEILFQGKSIRLLDTAGIRRRNRVQDILEKKSVQNSRKSYKNSDTVILMIDATTLESGRLDRQDLALAADVIKEGKALIVAFNKVDRTPYAVGEVPLFLKRNFKHSLSQLKNISFLFISALNHENINTLLQAVLTIYEKQKIRIKTSALNRWLADIKQSEMLQSASVKFKLKYMTQVGILPPTFLIFISNENGLREDHKRFISNGFRKYFELDDIPLHIVFRAER